MTSRCALLILLISVLGGTYLLENPDRSIITSYPRLLWVLRVLRRAGVRVSSLNLSLVGGCFLFEQLRAIEVCAHDKQS